MGRGSWSVLAVVAASLALAGPAQAEPDAYGLTMDNALVRFNVSNPTAVKSVAPLVGLHPGETAVAIAWPYDFRTPWLYPGYLYVLTSASRLYRVDPATGILWSQGPPLSPGVKGSYFGMTVEGYSDYLVALSDAGVSMGIAPALGWLPDDPGHFGETRPAGTAHSLPASYEAGDPAAGAKPSLVGAALQSRPPVPPRYEEDWLFGIDVKRDTLVRAKHVQGKFETVGPLGVPVGLRTGLALAAPGPGPGPALLATALDGTNASLLYAVDLETGAATLKGALPEGVVLRGLAYVPPPTLKIHGGNLDGIDFGIPVNVHLVERNGDPLPAVIAKWTIACANGFCPTESTPAKPQDGVIAFAPLQELAPYSIVTQRVDWKSDFQTFWYLTEASEGVKFNEYSSVVFLFVDNQPKLEPPVLPVHSSDGVVTVTVTRSDAAAAKAALTTYATHGGTAVPGRDYEPTKGTLKLAVGQVKKKFTVLLGGGRSDGKTRTVGLVIHSAGGRSKDTGTISIVADPKLRVKLHVGAPQGGRLPVTVSCSTPCKGHVTLRPAGGGASLDRRKVSLATGQNKVLRLHVGTATSGTVKVSVHDGLGRRAHATRTASLR